MKIGLVPIQGGPLSVQKTARPLVQLNGINKVYQNGTIALSDVNLNIANGEFLSLLGPSGCGKSTLLRLIAGLGQPTTGAIDWPLSMHTVRGEPEREIGFVFQDPTLLPWKTVFENVYLPLKLRGTSRSAASDRIRETLELVGLSAFANAYPRQLSGGMKMRASIARALVMRPRILLMDEPFAALDEISRSKLNEDLLRIWQDQKWTVVFVTHSVFESVYLSTRVVVMSARPGRMSGVIDVDSLHPRGEAYRTSPRYNELCRLASAELKRAMHDLPDQDL